MASGIWQPFCLNLSEFKLDCLIFPGQVLQQEWRLVICRYTVGDPPVRKGATLWWPHWRAGHRKLWTLLSQWRANCGPSTASELPQRNLWSDAWMLESWGGTTASVPWNTHVPAEEKHGLWPQGRFCEKLCQSDLRAHCITLGGPVDLFSSLLTNAVIRSGLFYVSSLCQIKIALYRTKIKHLKFTGNLTACVTACSTHHDRDHQNYTLLALCEGD